MSDPVIRRMTVAAVLLVAGIAAVISFTHIRYLAATHGQAAVAALLLPLSIDGTVVAASMVMLRAARAAMGTPWLARVMLGASVAATLAANLAYGARYGLAGALLSGWPAAAFIGCAEMALGMVRRATRRFTGGVDLLPGAIRSLITVSPESGCWEWQGPVDSDGYGTTSWQGMKWLSGPARKFIGGQVQAVGSLR
jgi:hypothetical protein